MIARRGGSLGSLLAPRWCVRVMPRFSSSLTSPNSYPPISAEGNFPSLFLPLLSPPLLLCNDDLFPFFHLIFFISLLMIIECMRSGSPLTPPHKEKNKKTKKRPICV